MIVSRCAERVVVQLRIESQTGKGLMLMWISVRGKPHGEGQVNLIGKCQSAKEQTGAFRRI